MAGWEFTYVDLHWDQGWEPVGEIVFAFDRGGPPSVSQLMFKRPCAE
jgi:hypothetical protein